MIKCINNADSMKRIKIENRPVNLAMWLHLTRAAHSVVGLIRRGPGKIEKRKWKQQAYTVLLRSFVGRKWMIAKGGCGVKGEGFFFFFNKMGNIIVYFYANGNDSVDRWKTDNPAEEGGRWGFTEQSAGEGVRVWDLVHSRGLILDRSKLGTPPVTGRKERTWHEDRYRMDVRVGLGGYSLFMFSTK